MSLGKNLTNKKASRSVKLLEAFFMITANRFFLHSIAQIQNAHLN